jgi:Cu(I)/Ag(I) efflux system membrane fusion protein
MKRMFVMMSAILAALLLLLLGYLGGRRQAAAPGRPATASVPAATAKGKVLYWYDPMVPAQHFDKPGLSPMGMQMVPKVAGTDTVGSDVRIDPRTVENLGIRTATVKRRVLGRAIRVAGTVRWDLRQAVTVSARADGIVTRLDVRAPYTAVAAGQPLAALLSPSFSSALNEYAALLQSHSADAQTLRAAARQRLLVMGLSDGDIRAAVHGDGAQAAVAVTSPQAGVVTTLDVREGQRVSAGQTLMTVNGLSTVWIEADIPQAEVAGIQSGTPVTATVDALPGHVFHGTVEALLPQVDPATRTQRARIVLDNPGHALAPGMFASVDLHPAAGVATPVVPDGALIATGHATRVIVADGDGHFRPVPVRTGPSADGYTAILTGLDGGERIVVSGQFLIDSEASLSGALERLDTGEPTPAPAAGASAPMPAMPGSQP